MWDGAPSAYVLVAAAVLLGLLLGLALRGAVERSRRRAEERAASARAVVRAARALAGERDAEVLLRAHGYEVIAGQAWVTWAPELDGDPMPVELRADYLVEADGRRYVAEVKTGEVAVRLATAATRRQLLEYRCAFDVDGVLLVCPELGTVQVVEFPGLDARGE